MPFVDTLDIAPVEKRRGWRGRSFSSPSMSFFYWAFEAGADIHRHHHEQEEVWHILEGELEITIDGETRRAGPGMSAIMPADTPHSVVALSAGRAIVVDYPLRENFL